MRNLCSSYGLQTDSSLNRGCYIQESALIGDNNDGRTILRAEQDFTGRLPYVSGWVITTIGVV
ncbi:hypothetical protein CS542_10820 [Pedobacter sp. IW39]|nr:hypothetical protein CS542_10820 [Pedobacter sp. IW39]